MAYEYKFNKEANKKKMEVYMTENFWEPAYDDLFSEDIIVDILTAPPGMPQHLDAFDYKQYRGWLARTTSNVKTEVQEYYGTPDPNVFWGIRDLSADVKWCKEPGKFSSKIFCRVEFKKGKICYIKINWNPLHFLYAIHAEVPVFRMDLQNPRVEDFLKKNPPAEEAKEEEKLDASPEAVAKRIQANLEAFMRPDYFDALTNQAVFAPNHESKVWFLPPEMKESYPAEMMDRVEAWTTLSCPAIDFDEAGSYWATDDPHVYFAEYMCYGKVDWIGNDAPGAHYRNRYFYVIRFDDLGRIAGCEEVLNPINKFNSIGVSIPTFPYYF